MKKYNSKIRMTAIVIISLLVIVTGAMFSLNAFIIGDIAGAIGGAGIATTILAFALFTFIRGYRDIKGGFPLKDERSNKVLEMASSRAFFVSLYMLLAIGFLSDDIIKFEDVSQATGIAVGIMAILFAVFLAYYNRKEL